MKIDEFTSKLYEYLKTKGDSNIAFQQAAYMRNRFRFLGLKSPILKDALRAFYIANGQVEKSNIIQYTYSCIQYKEREMWHASFESLRKYGKHLELNHIHDIKKFIIAGDWWDTTDSLAPQVVTTLVLKYPELLKDMDLWIADENMWIRRSAILYQLKLRSKTDWIRLQRYILLCANEKEFFIQKAIGWALREYSKTNPKDVMAFIEFNNLAPLSKREGLKWIKNKGL